MRSSLIALSLFIGPALSRAEESTASPPVESRSSATASSSVEARNGKIVIETDVNGKKETRVIDLNDPASTAPMQGKAVIATEINGKTETRIVDLKDLDKLLPPSPFNEKPLSRKGRITYLGVATMEVPRNVSAQLTLPPDTGLLIGAVAPDSPAANAGLKENDVLGKFDDQILITQRQLAVLIANHQEGDVVNLTYFRKGQEMRASATLGKHDAPAPMEAADPLARVTRDIWKLDPAGTPLTVKGEVPSPGVKRYDTHPLKATDNAQHDVGKEIRKALDKLPAEVRCEVEKTLKESGVLPLGSVSDDATTEARPVPPAAPGDK